jgi:hypothetical protein
LLTGPIGGRGGGGGGGEEEEEERKKFHPYILRNFKTETANIIPHSPPSLAPTIHPLIHSFTILLVFRHIYSLFLSEISTECNLVLPLSVSSIHSFP